MKRSLLTLTTALSLVLAPMAMAQDESGFRNVEEGDWYHPFELESWIDAGGVEQTLIDTLTLIESADGVRSNPDQPDTITAYGPGNWIYEFFAAGDAAVVIAAGAASQDAKFDALSAAMVYYHSASTPHVNTPKGDAALNRAFDAYADAAAILPGSFQRIDIPAGDVTFEAFVHVPEGDGPHPVLVFSNGSDMSKVTALSYYAEHLMPKGIAMIGVDLPGMGGSQAVNLFTVPSETLHVTAINWAETQDWIDDDNIFVQGNSFGGHAAGRVFLDHPELDLAGVAWVCGPLSQPFMAPPEAYAHFPEYTMDGVKTRVGLAIDASWEELAERLRPLAYEGQGIFEGEMIDTPLLAVNTNQDPVSPLEDMDKLLARAENAERVIFDVPGHCPPHGERRPLIATWIQENLR